MYLHKYIHIIIYAVCPWNPQSGGRISALPRISALQRKFSVTSRMEAWEAMQNKTILFR